ncbi:LacI family DNA-binding transcriptional regulator [Curtobacterium sp. RRHDQ10]|uniref:LacI family DNA-binding transcriptional regulator n=1 Tax=Curtobacterium phyllosphaerae TaxID=3413379 RepID=UPI003BF04E87
MAAPRTRVTQRMIADMAGVSQSTVSLVLNGKATGERRIPVATRDRVLEAIRDTTYVANPVARSLARRSNDLIGVFTYEPAFPSGAADFYTPLLTGIESAAEGIAADLLVFTSTPVVDGRRRLFHEGNRLRLADGCVLLGREMDPDELGQLLDTGYPFVAVGRRDAAEGRVPYVGVDYAAATRDLARRALRLGHERFGLIRLPLNAEASRDRRDGIRSALADGGIDVDDGLVEAEMSSNSTVVQAWEAVRASEPSIVFVEDPVHGDALFSYLAQTGVHVPEQISVIVLGEHSHARDRAIDVTRLSAPRIELGARAVAILAERIAAAQNGHDPGAVHELLPCQIIAGSTLTAPPAQHLIA